MRKSGRMADAGQNNDHGWASRSKSLESPRQGRPKANAERKNGVGNIYCDKSQGTLLDTWKQYTEGEDEDTVIQNIYTPQTSSGEASVVVAKKECLPTEQSREALRGLRKKAMVREQEEQTPNQFTSHDLVAKFDASNLDEAPSQGGTYYAVPNQKVSHAEDSFGSDEDTTKRKDRWFKKMFKPKH